jgi:hypothetical protein
MSKHTPGPWVAEEYPVSPDHTVWGVCDGNGRLMTDIHTEADARLIAAAPELLQALRWLLEDALGQDDEDLFEAERNGLRLLEKLDKEQS